MRIFIASSKESLDIAKKIASIIENLGHTPILWNEPGLFVPGQYTLESLEKISQNVNAAIIVFSEDDKTWYRKEKVSTVRDNVLIEYGLFMGVLNRERVIVCKCGTPKIASDLLGINSIVFDKVYTSEIDIKTWIDHIQATEYTYCDSWLKFGNFNNLFSKTCSLGYFNSLRIFAISTNRTVRILEGCEKLHIKNAEVLLRGYAPEDLYFESSMANSIETSINLWNKMCAEKVIDQLVIKKFNFHPTGGFYIFDNSFLILGNLHFTYPNVNVEFDKDSVLITDQSCIGKQIINWYIEKFNKIFSNF